MLGVLSPADFSGLFVNLRAVHSRPLRGPGGPGAPWGQGRVWYPGLHLSWAVEGRALAMAWSPKAREGLGQRGWWLTSGSDRPGVSTFPRLIFRHLRNLWALGILNWT